MCARSNRRYRRKSIRFLLLILLIVVLGAAAYLAKLGIDELVERKESNDFYSRLANNFDKPIILTKNEPQISKTNEPALENPTPVSTESDTVLSTPVVVKPVKSEQAFVNEYAEAAPTSEMDFDVLRKTCPDAVGWLRIDDTIINYPIVQGKDNSYYLSHLADGTKRIAGSIMLDCSNDGEFQDTVSVLHGHRMRNGSMFGHLADYEDESFYKSHSTIRLLTPAGDYDVKVFAAYTVNGYTFGYPTSFADENEFEMFIRKATSSTAYETETEVKFGDRLLLLSTCAYSFNGARFVVLGKIIQNPTA